MDNWPYADEPNKKRDSSAWAMSDGSGEVDENAQRFLDYRDIARSPSWAM